MVVWLLKSLAIATAFAVVLAGCAPATGPTSPVRAPPAPQPPITPQPPARTPGPPSTPRSPSTPRPPARTPGPPATPACIDTTDHGCISLAEFRTRRGAIAQQHLADSEYQTQSALERINAHQAHASLEVILGSGTKPGEGVTIGVIDSGVDLNHPELAGARLTETLLQGVPDETANDPRGFSHGTAVTSVIAAQPNNQNFIGLAWGADFKVFAAAVQRPGSYPGGYDPTTFDWSAAYRTVLASGVDIVNASYAVPRLFIENYTAAEIRSLRPELTVVAQQGVADPTIFVWVAGGSHGDPCTPQSDQNCVPNAGDPTTGRYNASSPSILGGAVARLPELRGHNVVVVALAGDGSIAGFSNRCGVAADWCIAAPGTGFYVAYSRPPSTTTFSRRQGGSYATPLVTGGLALMKQLFRNQLSNKELVTRLFATADKSGRYADRTSYGQGAMDLAAAVSPVGTPLVRSGGLVAGAGQSIQTTRLRLGSALGDGFPRAAAGLELAAFDELGAPFWFELPGLTDLAGTPSSLERLRELMAPPVTNSLLDLAGATTTTRVASGLELSFTDPTDRPTPEPGMGAMLSWQPRPFAEDRTLRVRQGQLLAGARLGWLGEAETLLGSKAGGGFGRLSAATLIGGFELQVKAGNWHLSAAAELGWTVPEYGGGIITDLSGLTTTTFSLHATRRLSDTDRLTFSLSQPPRLEQGLATLSLPIGRTKGGRVLYRSVATELTPSGRQLDLAASWQREGLLGGTLRAEAALANQPGHLETEPIFSLAAGWQVVF